MKEGKCLPEYLYYAFEFVQISKRRCGRGKLCSHIPLVPSVLFTAGTEPSKQQFTRIFEFLKKSKGLKVNVQTISFCQSPSIVARKVCKLKIQ